MHLPQGTIATWPCRQTVEQKQVPVSGRQVGQGNALLQDFAVQPPAVPEFRPAQDHGGAMGQRRVQLLNETIEVQGCELQYAVIGGQPRIAGGNSREFVQGAMVDCHTLGFAGRAGGINHIGQIVRVDGYVEVAFGVRLQRGRVNSQDCHPLGQRHGYMGLSQHQAHAAVVEHMSQAFARVLRIERHVGATRLEDRQQADHHGKGSLYRDTHQHFRPNALGYQAASQAVGLPIERVIAQRLAVEHQRGGLRTLQYLSFEQPINAGMPLRCRAAGVPGV